MNTRARPARQAGFTLIEVMLALSIFTMAALAALQVATEHLRSIALIEERAFATMVASNRMAEVHISDNWPPQNGATGQMQMAERTWYWRQLSVETVTDGLREVTIIVSAEEEGAEAARISGFVGQR
ncbi:MAG: type II secretion system minor pseudopilin GspI [Idiomarina sp.]|nr:type II secretion system minor pseudopilin GspI [Idiomarina sp.]